MLTWIKKEQFEYHPLILPKTLLKYFYERVLSNKTDRSYCEWCDFRAACRFDETAGDKVRWLKNIKDKEFWEQLGGNDNAEVDT